MAQTSPFFMFYGKKKKKKMKTWLIGNQYSEKCPRRKERNLYKVVQNMKGRDKSIEKVIDSWLPS